jgi:hypothetical protein
MSVRCAASTHQGDRPILLVAAPLVHIPVLSPVVRRSVNLTVLAVADVLAAKSSCNSL